MLPIRIRDARPDEYAAIEALTLDAYAEYASIMTPPAWAGLDNAVRAALHTPEHAQRIIAEQDGTLVGSVMLFAPESDAYAGAIQHVTWPELRLLAVTTSARGRGVGRRLVEECMRRARGRGAREIGLHTSHSMAIATKLYTDLGFERAPEHDFQPEGAELITAYRLPLD